MSGILSPPLPPGGGGGGGGGAGGAGAGGAGASTRPPAPLLGDGALTQVLSTPLTGALPGPGMTPGLMSHPDLRQRLPSDGGASTPSVQMSPIQTSRSGTGRAPAAVVVPHLSLNGSEESSSGSGSSSSSSDSDVESTKMKLDRALVRRLPRSGWVHLPVHTQSHDGQGDGVHPACAVLLLLR
jgi:hypothetical protein